ncbi:hypothetical protein Lalb_Chr03g0043431 [Lupinus albus]|uniref:Knottin, scorpion toxin n=1 Tax=Lupinus albus TaxID=3870 RepID=A0A6A4QVN8_LUPAL|nr:hypothetical protein Lalb_Chr03g0043431 [Lupinus albus]
MAKLTLTHISALILLLSGIFMASTEAGPKICEEEIPSDGCNPFVCKLICEDKFKSKTNVDAKCKKVAYDDVCYCGYDC